jgi:ankyrin repeat protein
METERDDGVATDTYSFGIDHPADRALATAAYNCDPLGIARALRAGALVDVASTNGFTPLMWVCFRAAVGFDPMASARWLLAAGADVHRSGGNLPATALTLACEVHDAALVQLLLRSGADADPPRHVDSPLHCALPADDVVALLLAAGADRSRRYRGQTALERYVEGWVDPALGDPGRDAAMARLLG